MKVLWLSNAFFSDKDINSTGTWLHSMAKELVQTNQLELYNITQGGVKQTQREDYQNITQWLVPFSKLNKRGLPNRRIIKDIQEIVSTIQPDIIHVWGTETYWGLLTARNIITGNVLLEIQGLKFEIQKYFYSGMNRKDLYNCIHLKEILKPSSSIFKQKESFKQWSIFEKEIIKKHSFITTQSEWVRNNVRYINDKATIFNTKMILREEFLNTDKWEYENCVPHSIFTSSSSIVSYKGLHILLDAIGILKKEFPDIKLNIAANLGRQGMFMSGYIKWLHKKIINLNIKENVNWLGSLNADEIVKHLKKANTALIPSFIESYCMALDEALHVGTPTIASFAGAMPELGAHKETVYYYQPTDSSMCAGAIREIFKNSLLTKGMSEKAYNVKRSNFDKENKADAQLYIYNSIVNKKEERPTN